MIYCLTTLDLSVHLAIGFGWPNGNSFDSSVLDDEKVASFDMKAGDVVPYHYELWTCS